MSLEKSLIRVENDILSGNYGKARDRLNSLVKAYPNNLDLRKMLGEIYWKLGFPAMAGRFWYLEEIKDPNMVFACEEFEKECGKNGWMIARCLHFTGDIKSIQNKKVREKLESIYVAKQELVYKDKKGSYAPPTSKVMQNLYSIGCTTAIVLGLLLMVIGFISVVNYVLR